MIFTFKKGTHRARPVYWLRWFMLLINPQVIKRRVTFLPDSKYWHPGDDQHDHNKLFGVGFMNPLKWSARFGWRYEPERGKFVISAFTHVNGDMRFEDICDVNPGHSVDLVLKVWEETYVFEVHRPAMRTVAKFVYKGHNRKWAILLGPYFGGNRKAPHDLKIKMSKI